MLKRILVERAVVSRIRFSHRRKSDHDRAVDRRAFQRVDLRAVSRVGIHLMKSTPVNRLHPAIFANVDAVRKRAQCLVAEMTLDEKFSWLSGPMAIPVGDIQKPEGAIGSAAYYPGIPRLGIPAMQQADASLGVSNVGDVRPGDHATGLPSSLALGASFNIRLAYESGGLVGREARAKGFNV